MKKTTKGCSILIVIGSWGGVYLMKGHSSVRLCLGFIAVTLFFYDLENALDNILPEQQDSQKS